MNWEWIIMSSTDPMKDDFLTLYGTKQRILHRPSHFKDLVNQRSLLLTKFDNTTHDVQLLLRANIEAFHSNCRFIFTCNYKNRIIEPLHSRCAVVEFSTTKKDKPQIASKFFKRIQQILDTEGVEYDNKVLVELINKHFPDWRRVLNECQRYAVGGKIDAGILATFSDVNIDGLMRSLQAKNFKEVRKWVVNNLDNDPGTILRNVYDALYERLEGPSVAAAVLIENLNISIKSLSLLIRRSTF